MTVWTPFQQRLRGLRRRLQQEHGQSIVEFAIILPVLILAILGILYFGRYENYANQETQLAEQGVRWMEFELDAPLAERARELARQKYSQSSYNRKR